MEKSEKNTIEETKDTEVVELTDKDLETITAGTSNQQKKGYDESTSLKKDSGTLEKTTTKPTYYVFTN